MSLEYLLRPWRDVGGGSLLVFWVGLVDSLRAVSLHTRAALTIFGSLGPTALRPNRYSLQTKLGITPNGDTLRSRRLLG